MSAYTVLTVLHDSAPEVAALLASLRAHGDPQVIAVDTASADDGAVVARRAGAQVVELGANPGFGAANNAGLALVATPVTVLCNPDVVVTGDALERLAAAAARRDALHVPRLVGDDGAVQESAHALPGSWAELARAVLPGALVPAAEPWRAARGPRPVGWAIAACVAARTATLRRLGPFDPDAFLFYEDLELCLRARAAGLPTLLHPELSVRHTGAHSTGPKLGPALLPQARRRREVVGARLGRAALARDDAAQALTFLTRAAARAVADPETRGRRERAQLAALRAARRRR